VGAPRPAVPWSPVPHASHGVVAGDSIHFRLLDHGEPNAALFLRRTTDLRNAHQNGQRREAYRRRLAYRQPARCRATIS
jgi:hypothetical protein